MKKPDEIPAINTQEYLKITVTEKDKNGNVNITIPYSKRC